MIKLKRKTLHQLPGRIKKPQYSAIDLSPGIVHIGLGNFHRAHQSWYLHRLMQQGKALDWGIIGAGVRPYDHEMRNKLAEQDYLTTLVELDPVGRSAEVVGSMIGYATVETGNAALIEQIAQAEIRIVSLTVTEGGYYTDGVSGAFDSKHPDIVHDAKNPAQPCTAFGVMIAALKLRRERGHGAFTCQSCDNLLGNGKVLRQTLVSLTKMSDPELAEWIDQHCSFPNSMVDCIVPATGNRERQLVQEMGIDDAAPVTHENFRQWVIEDNFCAGRPDWDRVGATFCDDVHGYEAQKVRILNAGHQLVANSADILGIQTISGAMEHKSIRAFFRKAALEEIVPHIDPVPDITPAEYVDLIDRRFCNPTIVDTVKRVAFDGSSRHPGFVLPTVHDALKRNKPLDGLALAEAAWARACQGEREDGSKVEANDPNWEQLNHVAKAAQHQPLRWLEMENIYGSLVHESGFSEVFVYWLKKIYQNGIEATLDHYLENQK